MYMYMYMYVDYDLYSHCNHCHTFLAKCQRVDSHNRILALCDEGMSHLRRAGGVRGRDPGERGRRSTRSVLIQVNDEASMIRHKLAMSHQGWTPVASA